MDPIMIAAVLLVLVAMAQRQPQGTSPGKPTAAPPVLVKPLSKEYAQRVAASQARQEGHREDLVFDYDVDPGDLPEDLTGKTLEEKTVILQDRTRVMKDELTALYGEPALKEAEEIAAPYRQRIASAFDKLESQQYGTTDPTQEGFV